VTVSGGDSGAVTGTWSFVGSYDNNNPYYPSSGIMNVSGAVSGTGGASGPWALTLTNGESQGLTLSYSGGEWSLDGQAGFEVSYKVTGGYDSEFTYRDHYRLATNLDVAGSGPGDGSAGGPGDGPDNVLGTAGNDAISAQAGNDTVNGGAGNDTVDGGSGIDVAVFSGARANYAISHSGSTWTVSGTDGVDTLVNVERLHFADEKVAIDTSGNGGQAYRLYKAAFDRVPDLPGLGYQMNELDKGFSLAQVATAFIASPEFQSLYGSAVDDTAFVTLLYRNVLDREPEAEGLAYHLNDLAHGVTRAQILANFSESPENQANVLGLIDSGMVYVL
jgi:serralysin